ncbi:hypothetical protein LDENG_00098980 [Lucifuga dentata]|nr:hypothetical protein LDENG_00098980 [Lucifuga dentata]
MDKLVRSNSRNTIRTDLSLLLECLKFQMKCPELQKQALLTIYSICEKKVYCKNSLCRKEVFSDLAGWLTTEDAPLTHKRVSVYLLSVLVANNKSGQILAQTTGCLDILLDLFRATFPLSSEVTWKAANATQIYQLWASVSSTLCGCVNNPQNATLASCLAEYGVVPQLFSLLTSPNLDPEERLSVLLTLGHCTVASQEHQSQLLQCGGLPHVITLLTEDTSEEVRKAATFILQTCKQATTSLRVLDPIVTQGEVGNMERPANMENYRSSAREFLHRIELLEKGQAQEVEEGNLQERGTREKAASQDHVRRPPFKAIDETQKCAVASRAREERKDRHSQQKDSITNRATAFKMLTQDEEVGDGSFIKLQSARRNSSCHRSCDMHSILQEATERFRTHRCNPPLRTEHMELTVVHNDQHTARISATGPHKSRDHWSEVSLTPLCKGNGQTKSCRQEHQPKKHTGISLTPLCRGDKMERFTSHNRMGLSLTPLKSPHLSEERRGESNNGGHALDDQLKTSRQTADCSSRRKRKDFTREEVRYLLCGVKTYGFSWNSILWSYPFQPGRTNVDLAKKYKRLMKSKAEDVDCT